jgi:hypothetical protein
MTKMQKFRMGYILTIMTGSLWLSVVTGHIEFFLGAAGASFLILLGGLIRDNNLGGGPRGPRPA